MKVSAGLLIYRRSSEDVEVFLAHPGGPFWARKDAWGLPKGECEEGEDEFSAARREFSEETGLAEPQGQPLDLGTAKSSGKTIHVFALEGNPDPVQIKSNYAEIEWPPRSGKKMMVPEIDKAKWLPLGRALTKIHKNQQVFIEKLAQQLGAKLGEPEPAQGSLF